MAGSDLEGCWHGGESLLERPSGRLVSMTFQSSFLIRCHMASTAEPHPVRAYYIQHVQTGAEFRSADLAEVTQWMTAQNVAYIQDGEQHGGEEA